MKWSAIRRELLGDFYLTFTPLQLATIANPKRYPLDRKIMPSVARQENLTKPTGWSQPGASFR